MLADIVYVAFDSESLVQVTSAIADSLGISSAENCVTTLLGPYSRWQRYKDVIGFRINRMLMLLHSKRSLVVAILESLGAWLSHMTLEAKKSPDHTHKIRAALDYIYHSLL